MLFILFILSVASAVKLDRKTYVYDHNINETTLFEYKINVNEFNSNHSKYCIIFKNNMDLEKKTYGMVISDKRNEIYFEINKTGNYFGHNIGGVYLGGANIGGHVLDPNNLFDFGHNTINKCYLSYICFYESKNKFKVEVCKTGNDGILYNIDNSTFNLNGKIRNLKFKSYKSYDFGLMFNTYPNIEDNVYNGTTSISKYDFGKCDKISYEKYIYPLNVPNDDIECYIIYNKLIIIDDWDCNNKLIKIKSLKNLLIKKLNMCDFDELENCIIVESNASTFGNLINSIIIKDTPLVLELPPIIEEIVTIKPEIVYRKIWLHISIPALVVLIIMVLLAGCWSCYKKRNEFWFMI